MPTLRKQKETDYTVVDNEPIQNEDLSWKARGILVFLLSMPDDWEFNEAHLTAQATDGTSALKSGLKELEEAGHLHRFRHKADDGTYRGWMWVICESPTAGIDAQPENSRGSPRTRKSDVGLSDVGKSDPTKEEENKVRSSTNGSRCPAPAREDEPPPDDPVALHGQYYPEVRLNTYQEDQIIQIVDDLDLWDVVLDYWKGNDYIGRHVKKMLNAYQEAQDTDGPPFRSRRGREGQDSGGRGGSARARANGVRAADIEESTQRSIEILERLERDGSGLAGLASERRSQNGHAGDQHDRAGDGD